jgi:hypothetical protein
VARAGLWRYPEFLIESAGWEGAYGVYTQHMYGWNGFLSTVLIQNSFGHLLATTVCIAASVGAVLFAMRGPWRPSSSAFPLAIGALAVATLLINPHAYLHDITLVGLALGLAVLGCKAGPVTSRSYVYLGAVALLWVLLSRTLWLQFELNLNLVTPILGALLVVLVRDSHRLASTATHEVPRSPLHGVLDHQVGRESVA